VARARRPTNSDGKKAERRRGQRFVVAVPLEASWCGPDGKAQKAEAIARQVNINGGFLEMASYPEVGSRITLTNFMSAATAEARVLATPSSREGVSQGIIVELVAPTESFWGVSLQVKKAVLELLTLEKALLAEGIDPRLLGEYREAVEFVRHASSVVQRLRERQLQDVEDDDVHALATADRVRRANSLCREVITDLDSGKMNGHTKGLDDLRKSLELASERLRQKIPV
jgi:hypothetical protein